jgi:hypothetical protein
VTTIEELSVTEPIPELVQPDDEGGDPAAPQPCQFGDEPATKSLLWAGGASYTPVCDEHEAEARAQLEEAGQTISGEVEIEDDADPGAVTAAAESPVMEVVGEDDGELRVEFPLIVIEGYDTSDGRYLEPGSLSLRALPLTLHVQFENAHGGQEPGPSIAVGRVDEMVRRPGPEVISPRTGEPYPEGSFVWSGAGAISTTAQVAGNNVAEWVRRRFLRGVSADLAGMDYDILGEDGFADVDPDNPRRQLVTHAAEFAGLTIVSVPAFGDCFIQLPGDTATVEPAESMPLELVASAAPSWRSIEVGDNVRLPALVASAEQLPDDAVDQIRAVIEDDGGEQRDAAALAEAIVAHIQSWSEPVDEPVAEEVPAMADTEAAPIDDLPDEVPDETGMPDEAQPCFVLTPEEHPATVSLLFGDGQYVPTCEADRPEAEATIADMGLEVTDTVEIGAPDPDADNSQGTSR